MIGAVEVFDTGPIFDRLPAQQNLIGNPHIGSDTEDRFNRQFADRFAQVNAIAEGAPVRVVNPGGSPRG